MMNRHLDGDDLVQAQLAQDYLEYLHSCGRGGDIFPLPFELWRSQYEDRNEQTEDE
jgi:hypothetical protein